MGGTHNENKIYSQAHTGDNLCSRQLFTGKRANFVAHAGKLISRLF